MTVLNELAGFCLVTDAIDGLSQGLTFLRLLKEKRIEHKQDNDNNGQDLTEIRNWI